MDLIVHYRQLLPDWATGEEKRTLSQIQSLQNAVLKCVNPKHYWKTAILSAKEIVSISNGVPFVAANSQQGLESVYERVMNEANSLIFEPVPPSTRWLFPPPPIIEKAEGIVKDKLYTFGGFLSNWTTFYDKGVVYDLGRSSVEAVKTFPLPKDFSMATQASATDRERYIYIAGGQRVTGCSHGSRTVYRFDAEREEFLRLPDLPHEVQSGMLTYVPHSNTLHYTGGSFNRSVKLFPHAPHYILHLPKEGPSVDKWQTTQKDWKWLEGHPFKDSTLLHHIAVTLKDKKGEEHLYILAGVSRDAGIIQSKRLGETVYECDTARDEPDRRKVFKYSPSGRVPWVRCKDLPIAFSHANPSHVRVAGGKGLLIFGGQTSLLKPTRRYRYSMAVMRHIILYVPSLGISRTVGYLPQWFRGEGAKALMAIRERVPLDGGGYKLGGILLFGGEQADPVNPPAPGRVLCCLCLLFLRYSKCHIVWF